MSRSDNVPVLSLNLNVHFHQLFIDGTYELSEQGEPMDLFALDPPTTKELDHILTTIIKTPDPLTGKTKHHLKRRRRLPALDP